jgi:hypothetical protein
MDTVEFAGDLEMSTNNSVCGSTTHTPSVRFDLHDDNDDQISPSKSSITKYRKNDAGSSGDSATSNFGSTEKLLEALSGNVSPTNLLVAGGASAFYRSEPRLSVGQSDTLQPAIRKQNSENRPRRNNTG